MYNLVVSFEGIAIAKSVLVALAYNNKAITLADSEDGSELNAPSDFMLEAIAKGTNGRATLAPVTSGTSGEDYTTFYTGIYVTTGTFSFDTKQDAFCIYYKIKDPELMNKAAWRFATVEEVRDLYKDNTGASVKVTDNSSPLLTYVYNPDTGCATDGGLIQVDGFTFTGSNKDSLTATTNNNKGSLTPAVPAQDKSPATLLLSVSNTGLAGTYEGSATTTWEITDTGNTGAAISGDTLSITNTGKAGTVTVKATTVADSVTMADTAEGTFT